jgi:hypothetical protein
VVAEAPIVEPEAPVLVEPETPEVAEVAPPVVFEPPRPVPRPADFAAAAIEPETPVIPDLPNVENVTFDVLSKRILDRLEEFSG